MDWLTVQARLREMEASLGLASSVTRRTLDEHAIRRALKEWDESLHPRDERGRFGTGGGGESLLTHEQAWQSTRERLDTSSLDGEHSNAIDPPNLSSATAEQNMLDLYNRSVAQGHATEDANWYIDKHNEIGQWADNLNVDHQAFTDAVAATSPLTAWNLPNSPRLPNLEAARAMVGADAAHPNLSAQEIRAITPHSGQYPFLGNSAENAVRALRGDNPDDVFNAPKIRSFNNNLSHPEHPFDVTVDTHMGRAMIGSHEKTPEAKAAVDTLIKGTKVGRGPTAQTVGGYGWAADRIRGAAATAGVHPPSAFQAVVWEQWRREGGALTTSRAAKMQTDDDFTQDLSEEEVAALWQDVADWADQGAHSDWKVPDHKALKAASQARLRYILARFDAEEKFNPYHDERGRFTNEGGGTFVSLFGKPTEEGRVVGATGKPSSSQQAAWPTSKAELDGRTISLQGGGGWGERVTRDGTPITKDTDMIVYHATDRETAAMLAKEGFDPATKPMNLARMQYEAGEYAEFEPGRGVGGGLYVAGTPNDASGYGRVMLGIRLKAGDLSATPEQESLASERVPAHPIEGLRVGDAMVNRKISPEDITVVHDNYQTTPSLESVAERMVQAGSKLAVKFNPYHAPAGSSEGGRFTDEGGAGFVSLFGRPSEEGRVVGQGANLPRERYGAAGSPQSHAEVTERLAALHDQGQAHARAVRDAADELANARAARDQIKSDRSDAYVRLNQSSKDLLETQTGRGIAEGRGEPKEVLEQIDDAINELRTEREQASADVGRLNKANDAAESRVFKASDTLRDANQALEQHSATVAATRDGLNDQLRQNMISEGTDRTASLDLRQMANQREYDKAGEDYQKAGDQWSTARDQRGMALNALGQAQRMYEPNDPEIAQRQAEYNAADQKFVQANAALDRANAGLDKASDQFWATRHEISAAKESLNDDLRAKYINAPEGPATLKMAPSVVDTSAGYRQFVPMTETPPPQWGQGVQVANEIFGKGAINESQRGEVPFHPMQPGDPLSTNGRAYCNFKEGVTMSAGDDKGTAVHETGHFFEDSIPGMYARVNEHIQSRTQGETYQPLKTLTGHNYADNEIAKPDDFAHPYMGKDYGGHADEFISMSTQKLYEDPIGFAKSDPQSYNFVMGLFQEARANGGFVQPSAKQASA